MHVFGRRSPVKRPEVYFSTMTEADRAGKKARGLFFVRHRML
jgi:hypothetical protein